MNWMELIIYGVIGIIVGALFGFLLAMFIIWRKNRKINKNAKKFLDGELDNKIDIDGKSYDVHKFRLREEDGTEKIIDLKGGVKIEDAKENKKSEERPKSPKMESYYRDFREDSRRNGKKERTLGAGSGRRIRRFG